MIICRYLSISHLSNDIRLSDSLSLCLSVGTTPTGTSVLHHLIHNLRHDQYVSVKVDIHK